MATRILPPFAGALLIAGVLGQTAAAQALPVEELTPAGVSGEYGVSVALDGDLAAVGARSEDGVAGNKEGAVHVWRHDGVRWVEEQKIIAADGVLFDYFGASVALDTDVLVVGAPYTDDLGSYSGAVYVYRFSGGTWNQEAKLLQPLGTTLDKFGLQVALDEDVLLVQGGNQLWFYRRVNQIIGWQMEHSMVVSPNQLAFDVKGDRAVVAQYLSDGATTGDGVVQVYDHDGQDWNLTDTLTGSAADSGDRFGHGVAVDGDVIAVGASLDDGTGSLYTFEWDGNDWLETARLLPSNGAGGEFGDRVDVSGFSVVVTSRFEKYGYEYRKEKGQWVETAIYRSPINDIGFPRAVAVDGTRTLLGSQSNHAYEFPSGKLRLTVTPLAPNPGATISIQTHAGLPDQPVLLYVIDVGGTPLFMALAVYEFGDDYAFTIRSVVPPGLSGLAVTFQSYGLGATGKLQASNVATVDFQ